MVKDKRFKGYCGEWGKISEAELDGKKYELWESDIYGSDAGNIITEDGEVIVDDSYNGLAVDLGDYLGLPYEDVAKKVRIEI